MEVGWWVVSGGVRGGVGIEIAKKSLAQLDQTGFGRSSSRDVECRVERPVCEVGKSYFAFLAVIGAA